jgi:hypothetical protein
MDRLSEWLQPNLQQPVAISWISCPQLGRDGTLPGAVGMQGSMKPDGCGTATNISLEYRPRTENLIEQRRGLLGNGATFEGFAMRCTTAVPA